VNFGILKLFFGIETTLALAGALWMWLAGYKPIARPNPLGEALLALFGYALLLGLDKLAEKTFAAAYADLERLMQSIGNVLKHSGVNYNHVILLALASAVGEEVWFRGAILNFFNNGLGEYAAVPLQAAIFAAGHPAPGKAGRFYFLWAFVAGVVFGWLYLFSGSLMPGILAHFLYNAKGFTEIYE